MLGWPFQQSATYLVQGWGFWLAIIGLIISVVGFWITLVQLGRTKKATAAVSEEVGKIQFAVSKYNAALETSRAESSLNAARKHVKNTEWDQANEALEAFSKALHTLRALHVPEIERHATELDGATAHAVRLCERLDAAGATGLARNETMKTLSTLREHDRLITSVRVGLDRSNLGE